MTDKDVKIDKIHGEFFEAVHDARHNYIQAMGKELSVDNNITLHDVMRMAVSASGILSTVQMSNVMQDCERIGKETGDEDTSNKLLVNIIAAGIDTMIFEIVPDMLGKETASKVTFRLLSSAIKQKIGDTPVSASASFSDIITDLKRH